VSAVLTAPRPAPVRSRLVVAAPAHEGPVYDPVADALYVTTVPRRAHGRAAEGPHAGVTDVMHVVEGGATVVTGGEMVDVRDVGPGERRARATTGGTPQHLAAGDVLVVPAGVPHHFVEVSDPFTYLVVKVGG
jgi:mannose-6-phosphate isomerase-like protein (cupin superfamily)